MPANILEQRFGASSVDLGVCSVGQNLNLVSARGFAKLDILAAVSGPDTFNQIQNREGTQRNLKSAHSQEAVRYALGASKVDPAEDARAFPEIILNARNLNVIEFYDAESGAAVPLSDVLNIVTASGGHVVGVRVLLDRLEYPIKPYEPEISRVDGNHRLSAANTLVESETEEELSFPYVPFALQLGLSKMQERKIFRDINGNHVGMEPAILVTFDLEIAGEDAKFDTAKRDAWVAYQLSEPGRAFENMVSMGGSTQEYRERFGANPPLKINTLKTAVKTTLSASPQLTTVLKDKPDTVLAIINNYWLAVREVLVPMWGDKKNYILLETIGLMAFSKWAGSLIDYAIRDGNTASDYYKPFLLAVLDKVPLEKEANKGLAGAAGQSVVYDKLVSAGSVENRGAYQAILEHEAKPDSIQTAFGDSAD